MGKLVVWNYMKATDFINRFQDEDDTVAFSTVVENLPLAKEQAIMVLKQLIQDVQDLKLKDIT